MNESDTAKSSDQAPGTWAPTVTPATTAACHVVKSVSDAPKKCQWRSRLSPGSP
jgi:hypothetical protein